MAKTALAEVKDQLPSVIDPDLDRETEAPGSQDVAIPFITILQALSPQVNKRESSYIDGAEVGMIMNTATQTVYNGETGITVIPCKYLRRYVEWKPNRGGLVKDWGDDGGRREAQCKRNEKGRLITPEGNDLVIEGDFYCLLVDEENLTRVIIPFTGTQFKKAKNWNAINGEFKLRDREGKWYNPKPHVRAWNLTTVPESNDQGNWFGWKINPIGRTEELPNGPDLMQVAREFRQLIDSGAAKVAPPDEAAKVNDEIPF